MGVPKERVYPDGTTIWWAYRTCGELMSLIHEEGMGWRVEKRSGSKLEEYILDFTKPYHNLLSIQREEEREGFKSPYVKQGTTQPFGYTGYRYDGISGSYFAQAREYQPHMGRFMAEDVIRGKHGVPKTLNRYGYCLGNPFSFIDPSGMVSEQEAQGIITENAESIFEAAEKFDVDPYVLAGCIYVEQIKNVDLKDEFDSTLVLKAGFDSSVGIGQIKVSTAKLLQEEGYMPYIEKPTFWGGLLGMTREAKIAFELEDNETNIYYAAAYLKYISNEWAEEYPNIWNELPDK